MGMHVKELTINKIDCSLLPVRLEQIYIKELLKENKLDKTTRVEHI
jgi:hypothetical protein